MNAIDRLRRGVVTRSAGETRDLAAGFAAMLPADATVALRGDLGVGKTTFVQGLARGLGVASAVTSPTFTICALHRAEGSGLTLVHLDAYRLSTAAQMESLLLDDFLVSPYCLAVEWPERIEEWLPKETWWLALGIGAGGRHTVKLC